MYQRGDFPVTLGGHSYQLRLTMGALADIVSRLGATGPLTLAEQLRAGMTPQLARVLLACLLRPLCGNAADDLAKSASKEELAAATIGMASVIQHSFEARNAE